MVLPLRPRNSAEDPPLPETDAPGPAQLESAEIQSDADPFNGAFFSDSPATDGTGKWRVRPSRVVGVPAQARRSAARLSMPSTSRGPGRLKQPLASSAATRPSRTARRAG